MKHLRVILLLSLLLIGIGFIVHSSRQPNTSQSRGHSLPAKSSAKSSVVSSQESYRKLTQLLTQGAPLDSDFNQLQHLARQLSDQQLKELIGEVGVSSEHFRQGTGLKGWIRSALFAEWSRRDPQAISKFPALLDQFAQDFLQDYPDLNLTLEGARLNLPRTYRTGLGQACFALIRGQLEREKITPDSIPQHLADIEHLSTLTSESHTWNHYAITMVFADLAKQSPQQAWGVLPPENEKPHQVNYTRQRALVGLFRGIESLTDTETLIEKWTPSWFAEDIYLNRIMERSVRGGPPGKYPSTEISQTVRREASLALARHDFNRAEEWIRATSTHETEGQFRHDEWARRNPQEAILNLPLLAPENQPNIARALINSNPTLAPDVLRNLPTAELRFQALTEASSRLGSFAEEDNYPTPDSFGTLPDLRLRYQTLLEAVDTAQLNPTQTSEIESRLYSLHRRRLDLEQLTP